MSDNWISQNLHNANCFHSLDLDFGIQWPLASITDEFKPQVHKQMLYIKGTRFLAIKIKASSHIY